MKMHTEVTLLYKKLYKAFNFMTHAWTVKVILHLNSMWRDSTCDPGGPVGPWPPADPAAPGVPCLIMKKKQRI